MADLLLEIFLPGQLGNSYVTGLVVIGLELMINWRNIEKGRPLNRIKPLE